MNVEGPSFVIPSADKFVIPSAARNLLFTLHPEEHFFCSVQIKYVSMLEKGVSILATLVLIAAVAALLIRSGLIATGIISGILQIAGLLLVLCARLTFGLRSFHFAANPTPGPLITDGPYRLIRNPIYASVLLICWTGVAVHWSITNGGLALLVTATLIIKIACEERLLQAAYSEYENYAKRTARIIPFVF